MSSFIKQEEFAHRRHALLDVARFLWSMPLFRWILPFCFVLDALTAIMPLLFRWYMGKLSDCGATAVCVERLPLFDHSIPVFTSGFLGIAVVGSLLRIASWLLFELSGQWNVRELHAKMIDGLSKKRVTYFDENPSGRLINRLVGDFDNVRVEAFVWMGDTLNASLEFILSGLIVALVSPWLLLLIPILVVIFGSMQAALGASLNRLGELARHARGRFLHRQNDLIDGHSQYHLYDKQGWLFTRLAKELQDYLLVLVHAGRVEAKGNFWIGLTTEIFAFLVMLVLAWSVALRHTDIAIAGTVVSTLLGLSAVLSWLTLATTQVNVSLVHVRRIFELVDLEPEEREEGVDFSRAKISGKSDVPHPGEIEFIDFSMSYRKELPLILNRFSAVIAAGSRTAMVGRTGAGKSSVMQSLLRMVYVQGGDIRIGGHSIYHMKVEELRGLFGIVPQQPWLFAGSLLSNLDRTGLVPTSRLRALLVEAQLPLSLDTVVEEGGRNFSPGERQLICLVRVLASDKPYLFLDEPTSSLDPETDIRMGHLIENHAQGRTMIVIAHRLETIRNCTTRIEVG